MKSRPRNCGAGFTPAIRKLTRAINVSSDGRCRVHAVNVAFTRDDPESSTIKFGVYPNKVGLQIFDREAAEAMVSAANSLGEKLADLFRGLPAYVGHPDDPEWAAANPGVRCEAVGRLPKMEITEKGLRLRHAWNDDGKRLIGGAAPVYDSFSPHWGMVETTYKGRKAFRPVELYSIGLTNRPNIPGTFIGLNEALPEEPNKIFPAMKKHIIALLAALGRPVANADTVSDDQLAAAVNESVPVATAAITAVNELGTLKPKVETLTTENAGLKVQLTAAQGQTTTAVNESAALRTSLATERAARAGLVITRAINEGRLTEAKRAEWLGKFTATGADFAAVEGDVNKLTKAVNTETKTGNLGARRGASPDSKKRVSAINEAVNAKMESAKCDRLTAYNQLRTEKPELFANAAE